MRDDATGRTILAHEPRRIPWLDLVFGFGPMLPIVAGAATAWWLQGQPLDYLVALATQFYAASILCFLAGVHRGVSFRTEGGPRLSQLVTMLVLYGLGLGSLLAAAMGKAVPSLAMLILGYLLVAVLDPLQARTGGVPLAHARLRPIQMPLAIVSLAVLLWIKLNAPY
ncbi:DUF3429 domain-containing protein [Methylobacterium aerolatum]|uniref:DUF3429 domain-containing protein n=1 Tax=Methylobacterium aerolatum TaxID=418708 RepID=A0ABU0HVE3_9HYPH|nr:DUF3429 domain-containing protein [Methylobacterium aerolatum]MDQ0446266.1 hypothetical protein [Methylobacterium aerolatum]GJD35609.1 hypothetical protein FMGBMHLM_2521 [Methylobacterium aerolatum]